MTLYEELYFEITLKGRKTELQKFARFLRSGALEDFFEMQDDYICFDDNYETAEESAECEIVFTNDDFGIEIDEFSAEEFLEDFCKAARTLEVHGHLCDADGSEFRFLSEAGDSYFVNTRDGASFNDELDAQAEAEERDEDE